MTPQKNQVLENTLKLTALLVCMATLCPAFAETDAVLTAAGYSAPAPLQVAPGQVTTLFFRDIGPIPGGQLRTAQATTVPLQTTLAGLSLRINQGQSPAVDIPLFAVRQESDCDGSAAVSPACLLTSVRLQIPFEIVAPFHTTGPNGEPTPPPPPAPLAHLMLDVDGQADRVFPLQPVQDNAHILTSCDVSWDTNYASVCDRQVYHADGHSVSEAEPAQLGETVVVYVYGLGQPSAQVPTGDVSPVGTVLTDIPHRVVAFFDNFVNTPSSIPRLVGSNETVIPGSPIVFSPIAFGGLTPGQIGMYQINIPVPQSLELAGPCGGFNGFIHANASLRVTTSMGTETLGLCVQP
jgi:hypothetical protein